MTAPTVRRSTQPGDGTHSLRHPRVTTVDFTHSHISPSFPRTDFTHSHLSLSPTLSFFDGCSNVEYIRIESWRSVVDVLPFSEYNGRRKYIYFRPSLSFIAALAKHAPLKTALSLSYSYHCPLSCLPPHACASRIFSSSPFAVCQACAVSHSFPLQPEGGNATPASFSMLSSARKIKHILSELCRY